MPIPTKTTLAGIFTILGTVAHTGFLLANSQPVDWSVAIAGITAGLGLIHAKSGSPKE